MLSSVWHQIMLNSIVAWHGRQSALHPSGAKHQIERAPTRIDGLEERDTFKTNVAQPYRCSREHGAQRLHVLGERSHPHGRISHDLTIAGNQIPKCLDSLSLCTGTKKTLGTCLQRRCHLVKVQSNDDPLNARNEVGCGHPSILYVQDRQALSKGFASILNDPDHRRRVLVGRLGTKR